MEDGFTALIREHIDAFPRVPDASVALLSFLDGTPVDASRIEAALSATPEVSAILLHLASLPYFGLAERPRSPQEAMAALGEVRMAQLIMAGHAGLMMQRRIPGYELRSGDLWRHSVGVSMAADSLVKELAPAESSVRGLFIAAIFHDIGKLILGRLIRQVQGKIDSVTARGESFEGAERQVIGTDHAEVSARILESWGFPEQLAHAVRWSHRPAAADPPDTRADILHVADTLCLSMGIGVGKEGLRYKPSPEAARRLGIKPPTLEWVASQTLQWVNQLM